MRTLDDICEQVRLLVGTCKDDIPEAQIEGIVQDFWTISFPALIKTQDQKGIYTFVVRPGVSVYPYPDNFFDLNPPADCEGGSLKIVYGASTISHCNYYWIHEDFPKGTDKQKLYTLNLKSYAEPTGIVVFSDKYAYTWGNERLKYFPEKRTVSIELENPIPQNDRLRVRYMTTVAARPEILYLSQDSITVYPIPDRVYVISVAGIRRPDPLPYQKNIQIPSEYFDLIVYGSALKLAATIDLNFYATLYPLYLKAQRLAMAKTYNHLSLTPVTGI